MSTGGVVTVVAAVVVSGSFASSSPSPKVMSVNVGMSENIGVSSGMSKSKSLGNGIVSPIMSVWTGVSVVVTGAELSLVVSLVSAVVIIWGIGLEDSELNADVCIRPRLLRIRMYAGRSSAGIFSGRSESTTCGVSESVFSAASVSVVSVDGVADTGTGCRRARNFFMYFVGIVISGFLVRIISVVHATYRGRADNNSIPNTKPANPCSSARIRCCHWCGLNILKRNRKYNIAHIDAM